MYCCFSLKQPETEMLNSFFTGYDIYVVRGDYFIRQLPYIKNHRCFELFLFFLLIFYNFQTILQAS
jgi:hypothetical protein